MCPDGPCICVDDCDSSGDVFGNEVTKAVNIVAGGDLSTCPQADANCDGDVFGNEVTLGVNNVANGCPEGGTPSPGGSPTPTPLPGACGNGTVDAGEDCDDGGHCLGGTNAGTACTSESQCMGTGICIGGAHAEAVCTDPSNCPGGKCLHCVPQGGDGCAANCTSETSLTYNLKQGVLNGTGTDVNPGTSGAVVHGDTLTIPLALSGQSQQTVIAGKEGADHTIPVVIPASSVHYPPIAVQSLACACVRGAPAKTCGGTIFEADFVTPSTDCTPTYTAGDSVCAAPKKPCAFVHGAGNSATGSISCNAGLVGIDYLLTQDDLDGSCSGGASACTAQPVIAFSGTGVAGSGILVNSIAIGVHMGPCPAAGTFCQADPTTDPEGERGSVATIPLVTGTASCMWTNANGIADNTICKCSTGDAACPAAACTGPWTAQGAPLDCAKITTGNISGSSFAGCFNAPGQAVIGDGAITNILVAGP
jgi:hypothetical protein